MEMRSSHKILIYLLFALSGFCALVYEILWTKYLSLTFGTTMIAISLVAATFMGGLALGSWLLGRYVDHESNLLRIYAILELGIALCALLFIPALSLLESIYVWVHQLCPSCEGLSNIFRLIGAALLLLPPTICMGGTFPLMCRFFARKKSGGQIGRLYALNTFGATLGAFLAGYLLLPVLGLSATGYLAATLNLLIAAVVWIIARSEGEVGTLDVSRVTRPELPLMAKNHRLSLIAIGLIGAFSLAYEILWTRVFLLFLGNTTYAFSLMLSAFLVGLALGGALYARLVKPDLDEKRLFVQLTLAMALVVVVAVPFYDQLAHVFLFAHQASGERWWHLSMLSYLIVFAIMALPAMLSGCLLPAAVAILNPGKGHTGEGVGLVVLHNTVGAVGGSLVAGFLLIPLAGILDSFRIIIIANLLLALALWYSFRTSGRLRVAVPTLAVAGVIAALFPFSWDPALMNSGVYIYAPKYTQMGGIDQILSAENVVEVIEGRDTTVSVNESIDGLIRFFTVNGKTDGGNGRDMSTQLLVGHLPLLLHQSPDEVLVIGLGTGITLKGLSAHPVKSIDCVEISPEVVEASTWFKEANGRALNDPKVHLTINDGRNLLLTSPKMYDVIVSEPSNPWQSGNANLFTADFYELAATRLKPKGLLCQWIGLYDITPENLRIACNTFLRTFPKAMIFKAGTDLIMVGGQQDLAFDYQILQERLDNPIIRQTLAAAEITSPGDLLARNYLYSEESLRTFSAGAGLNTDDHPVLEFSARYNLGERTMGEFQQQNMESLLGAMTKVYLPLVNLGDSAEDVATALRDLGKGYARAGRQQDAENFMRKAAAITTDKS